MDKVVIKPFNIVDQTYLPEIKVDQIPEDGDPLEIDREMYYVCENILGTHPNLPRIEVIPLVVRDPLKISNIKEYIACLSIAHRRVLFRNANGICDLENCDEMIIS